MKNTIKIIILAAVSAALAIVAEQAVAAAVSIFWKKEIVLESFAHFTWFLIFAAIVEEISKYWAVYFVIRKIFGLEKIRFVAASLLLGIMWGIFEIGLVLFSNQHALDLFRAGNPEILFSFATMIALHAVTAFLLGIFIWANIFSDWLKHLKVLFFPVLIHLLFNFLIIQRGDFTNYLVVISLSVVFCIGAAILAFNFRKLA